jgi:hypothetical protein
MASLLILISTVAFLAPAGSGVAAAYDPGVLVDRVKSMDATQREQWLSAVERRLDSANRILLPPADADKKKAQNDAVLHQKSIPLDALRGLLRDLDSREKSAMLKLNQDYRIQLNKSWRSKPDIFNQRLDAALRVQAAWDAAGRPFDQQEKMVSWLSEAMKSISSEEIGPLPADPRFDQIEEKASTEPNSPPTPPKPQGVETDKTIDSQLATGQPKAVQPKAVQQTTEQPATVQPATVQPATVQPATVQPATVQPATVQPATVQPKLQEDKTPSLREDKAASGKVISPTTEPTPPAPDRPRDLVDGQVLRVQSAAEMPVITKHSAQVSVPIVDFGPEPEEPLATLAAFSQEVQTISTRALSTTSLPNVPRTHLPWATLSADADPWPAQANRQSEAAAEKTPPVETQVNITKPSNERPDFQSKDAALPDGNIPRTNKLTSKDIAGGKTKPPYSSATPLQAGEEKMAGANAWVNVANLAARIAGYNSSVRDLQAGLDEDQPWTSLQIEPLLGRLKSLQRQRIDLEIVRELAPEGQRAGLAECISLKDVISLLGTRIFEARAAAAGTAFSGTRVQRQVELDRLDSFSRELAAIAAEK